MNGHRLTRQQRDQLRQQIDAHARNRLDQLAAQGKLATKKPGRHQPWRTTSPPLAEHHRRGYTSS